MHTWDTLGTAEIVVHLRYIVCVTAPADESP